MSVEAIVLTFAVGGALLALWTDVRFPGLGPSDLRGALFRLVAALTIAHLVGPALAQLVDRGVAPGIALLALGLPAFLLFFLAAIWAMRVLQGMLYGLRR